MEKLKYIVLGSWRTGSTVLHESLEKHPDIKIAYEIFHEESSVETSGMTDISDVMNNLFGKRKFDIEKNPFYYKHNKLNHNVLSKLKGNYLCLNQPLHKIIDYIFDKFNAFKIIYAQLNIDDNIWNYLLSIKDLKVIHTVRQNYFDILVSVLFAYKTNIWQKTEINQKILDKKIIIDRHFCDAFFNLTEFETEHYISFFSNHSNIIIDYNSLFSWDSTIKKVQKFLDVRHIELPTKYYKRTDRKIKNLIENYKELSDYFKNTKWKNFFDGNILL